VFGFGKRRPRLSREPDQVFLARARADAALCRRAIAGGLPAIVTSFFPASLARVSEQLRAEGASPVSLVAGSRPVLPLTERAGPWLLDAKHLTLDVGLADWVLRAGLAFRFLFVEHYPLVRAEAAALDVLRELGETSPQHVAFYVGLDEPLLAAFDGARLVALMERLGLPPDEPVAHPWVNESIARAQAKLERRLPSPLPADSVAEWFRLNGPGQGG